MSTIAELDNYVHQSPTDRYTGPTTYMEQEVAQWHHPSAFINTILNTNKYTKMTGISIMAPPGHGKSTLADVLAHRIHLKAPEFSIIKAGAYEFTHQQHFFKSLPKRPTVVKFDDVTGSLEQMSDREIAANFEALTKVRWTLDPEAGQTPIIIMVLFHYSKKLEKAFRAQFGYKIFVGFGDEEKTNIDQLVEKGSTAYYKLRQFSKVYQQMFEHGEFELNIAPNIKRKFITDIPFRCACAITLTSANLMLFAKKDVCEYCTKKPPTMFLAAEDIYNKIFDAYGHWGMQALKLALYDKGFYNAISPSLAAASDFVKEKVLSHYETDYDKLIKLLYGKAHKKVPERVYHKRKMESALSDEFVKAAIPIDNPTIIPSDNLEIQKTNQDVVQT